ncbi:DUF1932 domain-containing protein [Streptomyces luteireticuli]|uniref:NAD(P)-dependent oxidoreductase n=1 Tax=Streptomyces luteireticuli TaxID=173858 RepID=A0ABN0YTG2_9ACTN
MTTITLLHPGSMGAAVGAQAVAAGHRVLWVPEGRSQRTYERAEFAGLTSVPALGEALDVSSVAISVCPPAAAGDVAGKVNKHGFTGLYVEANAISPQRVQHMAADMAAHVLDGAITGPPPPGLRTTRLYLAGDPEAAEQVGKLFAGTAVEVRSAGETIGAASALKMAFATFQRPARTLAALAYALADAHQVTDLLLDEAARMPSEILSDPDYLPSVAARSWRWAPEMGEVAEALRAAELPTDLAEATAAVMRRWEPDKDRFDMPLAEALLHLKGPTGT